MTHDSTIAPGVVGEQTEVIEDDAADLQDPFGQSGYQEGLDDAAKQIADVLIDLITMGVPSGHLHGILIYSRDYKSLHAGLRTLRATALHFIEGGGK